MSINLHWHSERGEPGGGPVEPYALRNSTGIKTLWTRDELDAPMAKGKRLGKVAEPQQESAPPKEGDAHITTNNPNILLVRASDY